MRAYEALALLPPAGPGTGQRDVGPGGRVDEAGSVGEFFAGCATGAGDGIPAGATGMVTLTLLDGM